MTSKDSKSDQTLALLWRTQQAPARGPRHGLDVDRIVRTAIEVADADGVEALSMRRVAQELGVGTMSLYTYVPGKAELLDAMADLVATETTSPPTGDWRAALEQIAQENWRLFHRHPWLLARDTSRPALGPGVAQKYNDELSAIDGIGLTDVEMDTVLAVVIGHAESTARRALGAARLAENSDLTDEQWWATNAPVLEQLLDPARFPVAVRVGRAAGQAHGSAADPRVEFDFGLQRLLDGLADLLEERDPACPKK